MSIGNLFFTLAVAIVLLSLSAPSSAWFLWPSQVNSPFRTYLDPNGATTIFEEILRSEYYNTTKFTKVSFPFERVQNQLGTVNTRVCFIGAQLKGRETRLCLSSVTQASMKTTPATVCASQVECTGTDTKKPTCVTKSSSKLNFQDLYCGWSVKESGVFQGQCTLNNALFSIQYDPTRRFGTLYTSSPSFLMSEFAIPTIQDLSFGLNDYGNLPSDYVVPDACSAN